MKKGIILALCFVTLLTFTACGKKKANPDAETGATTTQADNDTAAKTGADGKTDSTTTKAELEISIDQLIPPTGKPVTVIVTEKGGKPVTVTVTEKGGKPVTENGKPVTSVVTSVVTTVVTKDNGQTVTDSSGKPVTSVVTEPIPTTKATTTTTKKGETTTTKSRGYDDIVSWSPIKPPLS